MLLLAQQFLEKYKAVVVTAVVVTAVVVTAFGRRVYRKYKVSVISKAWVAELARLLGIFRGQ